ncbi:MAG: hypothetical protein ACJ72I_08540 [Pseudonocardiaceae bacterium]|jgi:hypothetical protein
MDCAWPAPCSPATTPSASAPAAGADNRSASGEPRHTAKAVHHLHHVRHHQLFFANMLSTRGAATTLPRRYDRRGRPRKPAPAPVGRPATRWVQPLLFDGLRRDYTPFDEREHANPDNPWLGWATTLPIVSGRPAAGAVGSAPASRGH